jgi:hypothetical protein
MQDLNQLNELMGLLAAAKWAVIIYIISYMLRAFGLSLLGAHFKQRSTWTAWLPVLNNYLVCRLAKTSPALMIPALIPLLSVLADAYLGVRMAKAAGKNSLLGLLYGVPVFGNGVPLLLGLGAAATEEKKDDAAQTPFVSALIHASVVCGIVLGMGLSVYALGWMTRAKGPQSAEKVAAGLPKQIAGTLTEFPIDTATEKQAKPGGVVTQFFGSDAKPTANKSITQEKLPPWIAPNTLPAAAKSAMAAEYTTGEDKVSVNVVSLDLRGNSSDALARPTAEQLAEISPGATVSGIELKSARNESYLGYRVSSPDASYYALQKTGTNAAVLISAINAASTEVAARLAANIGAGNGLLDDEGYREVFASVPPPPDDSAQAQDVLSFTEADVSRYMAVIDQVAASNQEVPNELRALYPVIRQVVPRTVTVSTYEGSDGNVIYTAFVANFPSSAKAWASYQVLDGLKATALAMIPGDAPFDYQFETIEISGSPAMHFTGVSRTEEANASASAVLLRRGGSIVVMLILNNGKTVIDVKPWAERFTGAR